MVHYTAALSSHGKNDDNQRDENDQRQDLASSPQNPPIFFLLIGKQYESCRSSKEADKCENDYQKPRHILFVY